MELSPESNSDLQLNRNNVPRPVVLVLLDAWGIAPYNPGNAFSNLKLKNFSNLIKNYPTALLSVNGKNKIERYKSLGASGLLAERLSATGFSQLNLSESEKVIFSWYYLNGGRDKLLNGEELKVISSQTGERKDSPEQVLPEIIKIALRDIKKGLHDFLVVNLSNLDLVSIGGDLKYAQEAATVLDKNLGYLVSAVLKHKGLLIITAAYGHAEAMINASSDLAEIGITNNPVPFIIVSRDYQGKTTGLPEALDGDLSLVEAAGTLDDVTPTILKILNITPPENMLGKSLI